MLFKLLKICFWGGTLFTLYVFMKIRGGVDYWISFILTLLLFLLYIWFKHRGKLRRLTKEWILKIVPEIEKGNLRVPGKLISSIYPAYIQHQNLSGKIKRLIYKEGIAKEKIEFFRQMIGDYHRSISAIKDIGDSEGLDTKFSPNIRRIEKKIEKAEKSVSFWERKLSTIVKSREDYDRQKLVVESVARKIIANWATGLGTKLGDDIKKIIEKEAKERENVEKLISETIDMIESAIKRTKNQDKLIALKILQEDVLALVNEFRNSRVLYDDFKREIAERKEEAEILSQDNSSDKEEKFDNNSQETYYNILEVSPNASQEEIRKAYHKKAHEYHPDKFIDQPDWVKKQSEEMIKKINIAYDTLKSPEKRKKYDEEIS